ncbi:hypothetical protein BH23DEI1_BH23DEI1_09100 [soil metagenome]
MQPFQSTSALLGALALAFALFVTSALAHQTITVGDGPERFDIAVGFTREPVFT